MNKIKLLNAAVMPQTGTYIVEQIPEWDFCEELISAEEIESYIGYPAVVEHLRVIAGVIVPLSRERVTLQHGDVMLVCRLKYRLDDPAKKADKSFTPSPDDYEYLRVTYYEPQIRR